MENSSFCVLGHLLTPDGLLENSLMEVRAGKIKAIHPGGSPPLGTDTARTVVYQDLLIVPGLIDSHIHGGQGVDFLTATPTEIVELLAWLSTKGVSGVLPTLSSSPLDQTLQAISNLWEAKASSPFGDMILGLHLEGPYINPQKRGAQPLESIRPPHLGEVKTMIETAQGLVRLITLAPEMSGVETIFSYLLEQGVAISIGHSNATYQEARLAFERGATRVTHLFNGMAGFSHREPGLIGAALDDEHVFTELTLDGIHVHPVAARIALKAKGTNRVVLITDAMQATGLPEGEYLRPGNRRVIVKEGAAWLENGTLAGSILTLDHAVKNAVNFLGLSLTEAIRLASENVATSLNLPYKGRLSPGADADFIVIDPQINVYATYVKGKPLFEANKEGECYP